MAGLMVLLVVGLFVAAAIGWLHALGWKSEAKRMLVDYRCVDDLHTRSQRECQRLTRQVAELMQTHRQEVTQYETQIRDNSEAAERREELLRAERDATKADLDRLRETHTKIVHDIRERHKLRRVRATKRSGGEKCWHYWLTIYNPWSHRDETIRVTEYQYRQFRAIAERNSEDAKADKANKEA